MPRTLLAIACHEYAVAALLYLIYLVRQWKVLPPVSRTLVASGLLLHLLSLVLVFNEGHGLALGMAQGFSALAFLLLVIFLAVDLRYKTPVIGAFVMPGAVAVLTPGLLLSPNLGPVLSAEVRRPLLPVHVTIALIGIAAVAVAAVVAGMYLLMERQVKGKRFGLLFSRLPSLHFLDELNRRLVIWGFIALSVTLVTGVFFSSPHRGLFWEWGPKEVATLTAWGVFGALLNARFFGWQGKRVALLTMAGFCILLVSFFSSYSPRAGGMP